MLMKDPPAYTVEPFTPMEATLLLALGSKAVARPVVASRAAIQFLVCPPIFVKIPPTYTVEPFTNMVVTTLLALGSQAFTDPSALIRAIRFLVTLPSFVKPPPIYQPPLPSGTATFTDPLGRG